VSTASTIGASSKARRVPFGSADKIFPIIPLVSSRSLSSPMSGSKPPRILTCKAGSPTRRAVMQAAFASRMASRVCPSSCKAWARTARAAASYLPRATVRLWWSALVASVAASGQSAHARASSARACLRRNRNNHSCQPRALMTASSTSRSSGSARAGSPCRA
jgi:hypothetical protein